jgi:hypothetical protein
LGYFGIIERILPSGRGYLTAMEPNPAPSDNGEIEEKPRLHAHTTSGHGSCAIIIKIEMEREMVNSKPLARLTLCGRNPRIPLLSDDIMP